MGQGGFLCQGDKSSAKKAYRPTVPLARNIPSVFEDNRMSNPHRGLPLPARRSRPSPDRHTCAASSLGDLPVPPSRWAGQDESMPSALHAKAEEDRRKQEEKKTRQESVRLDQRRIEERILRDSLQGGIPPPMVPLIFAGLGGGALPAHALEWAQQYLVSLSIQNQRQQQQIQAHQQPLQQQQMQQPRMSPDSRDSRMIPPNLYGSSHQSLQPAQASQQLSSQPSQPQPRPWDLLRMHLKLLRRRDSTLQTWFQLLNKGNSYNLYINRKQLLLSKDLVMDYSFITGRLPTLRVVDSLRPHLTRAPRGLHSLKPPIHIYGLNIKTHLRNERLQEDSLCPFHQRPNLRIPHLLTRLAHQEKGSESHHPDQDSLDNIQDNTAIPRPVKQRVVTYLQHYEGDGPSELPIGPICLVLLSLDLTVAGGVAELVLNSPPITLEASQPPRYSASQGGWANFVCGMYGRKAASSATL